jgi:hypothetical protein
MVSGSKKDKKPESKLHRWWDKQDNQINRNKNDDIAINGGVEKGCRGKHMPDTVGRIASRWMSESLDEER